MNYTFCDPNGENRNHLNHFRGKLTAERVNVPKTPSAVINPDGGLAELMIITHFPVFAIF